MKKIFFFLLASTLFFASCVKQKFDEPTLASSTVDFTANTTIAALKKLHTTGGLELIKTDIIIEGTVIADDASGNFYKTIVIQDATAGIEVKINVAGLANDFPIGSKVLIKCNGLTLGDYAGLTQLGGGNMIDAKGNTVLASIEQLLIGSYIFKAGKGAVITPKVVKISDLNNSLASTLIQIDNVEFAKLSFGVPFADGTKKVIAINRNLVDCTGGTMFLRTSSFATFVNDLTPTGNGSIVGVYSTFNVDKQLYLRDLNDVSKMTNTRCDGTTGGGGTGGTGGGSTELFAIGDLRAVFTGTKTTAPANKYIKGVVISDAVNKNVQPSSCIVQGDDGKGITVRFTATHPYLLGDAIQVDVAGLEISEYNGLLQVNNVPLANAKKLGKGTLPTPKKLTIAQIIADFENVESTLVAIDNCSHTASKYGGNVILDDKTGKITLFTSSSATLTATFAADVPVSNVLNIVGIIGQYTTATANTNQIQMRNLADATKGTGGTGGGTAIVEPIGTIRSYFTGTLTKVPANKALRGVVISDKDGKNIPALNVIVQGDDGKGILVRLTGTNTFPLGELLEIDASNMELSEFNGLLQLNKIPLVNVKDLGKGVLPTPKVVTLGQLATDAESLESTLVQVKNVDFGGADKYGGTIKITDGTGTFDLFTSTSATYTAVFGADVPPTGVKTLTAIVSQFTTYQLQMRNAGDVK